MKHLLLVFALLPAAAQSGVVANPNLYNEEIYVTRFGLMCLKLTRIDSGAPAGLSCDWSKAISNNGEMLRPSRKMPEPLTSDFAKQQEKAK